MKSVAEQVLGCCHISSLSTIRVSELPCPKECSYRGKYTHSWCNIAKNPALYIISNNSTEAIVFPDIVNEIADEISD